MKIYIGADHNGFDMKRELSDFLERLGYEAVDDGDSKLNPDDDFPQFAAKVVSAMKASSEEDPKGILICGSGQGMVMAANRYKGIRASLIWDVESARLSRNDDNANILCLPARLVDQRTAEIVTNVWLKTPFAAAPRFKRRIRQMDEL